MDYERPAAWENMRNDAWHLTSHVKLFKDANFLDLLNMEVQQPLDIWDIRRMGQEGISTYQDRRL